MVEVHEFLPEHRLIFQVLRELALVGVDEAVAAFLVLVRHDRLDSTLTIAQSGGCLKRSFPALHSLGC
jgi:hypothetical protein